MADEITLSEVMKKEGYEMPRHSSKASKIQDWLKQDHKRNEFERDVEQLQHDIGRIEMFLIVSMVMMVLVLSMQVLLWSTGL